MRETIRAGDINYGKNKGLPGTFQQLLFPYDPPPQTKSGVRPAVENRCVNCGSVVGKGRSHKFNKVTARENTLGLVRKLSLKSKERTTRDALMSVFEDKGTPKSPKSGFKTTLATGGRRVSLTYGGSGLKGVIRKRKWTKESLLILQTLMNLSDRGVKYIID